MGRGSHETVNLGDGFISLYYITLLFSVFEIFYLKWGVDKNQMQA